MRWLLYDSRSVCVWGGGGVLPCDIWQTKKIIFIRINIRIFLLDHKMENVPICNMNTENKLKRKRPDFVRESEFMFGANGWLIETLIVMQQWTLSLLLQYVSVRARVLIHIWSVLLPFDSSIRLWLVNWAGATSLHKCEFRYGQICEQDVPSPSAVLEKSVFTLL